MPQLFKIGAFIVYFWANENMPLEPLHVHIAEGKPQADATKVWITQTGHCILANNKSRIPANLLRQIMLLVEANQEDIKNQWMDMFGEIRYFC